jgi:hypothetical protein
MMFVAGGSSVLAADTGGQATSATQPQQPPNRPEGCGDCQDDGKLVKLVLQR